MYCMFFWNPEKHGEDNDKMIVMADEACVTSKERNKSGKNEKKMHNTMVNEGKTCHTVADPDFP